MKKQLVALIAIFTINQVNATCFDIFNNTDQKINIGLGYGKDVYKSGDIAAWGIHDQCAREGRTLKILDQITLTIDDNKPETIILSNVVGTKGTKGKSGIIGDGILEIFNENDATCIFVKPNKLSPYNAFTLYKGPKADKNAYKLDEHNYCQKFTLGCKKDSKICSADFNKTFQQYRMQIGKILHTIEKKVSDLIDEGKTLNDADIARLIEREVNSTESKLILAKPVRDKFISTYKRAYKNAIDIVKDFTGSSDMIKKKIQEKVLWYMENIQDQVDVFDQACIAITGNANSTPCFPQ